MTPRSQMSDDCSSCAWFCRTILRTWHRVVCKFLENSSTITRSLPGHRAHAHSHARAYREWVAEKSWDTISRQHVRANVTSCRVMSYVIDKMLAGSFPKVRRCIDASASFISGVLFSSRYYRPIFRPRRLIFRKWNPPDPSDSSIYLSYRSRVSLSLSLSIVVKNSLLIAMCTRQKNIFPFAAINSTILINLWRCTRCSVSLWINEFFLSKLFIDSDMCDLLFYRTYLWSALITGYCRMLITRGKYSFPFFFLFSSLFFFFFRWE